MDDVRPARQVDRSGRQHEIVSKLKLENIRDVFPPPAHRYIAVIVLANSFIVIRQGAPHAIEIIEHRR